jgi:hypothetical protein
MIEKISGKPRNRAFLLFYKNCSKNYKKNTFSVLTIWESSAILIFAVG